eukprot:6664112-Ditylum_brightwellii.AAC.1
MEENDREDREKFTGTLGCLVQFMWLCMMRCQGINGRPPLATNKKRYHAFAKELAELFGIKGEAGFQVEDIYVV